ncbi:MAG: hypothetical protein M3Q65_16650, partial [Chloroflexota bacterium]|nr:hypothetical protein [Chloroflexota bacterium]
MGTLDNREIVVPVADDFVRRLGPVLERIIATWPLDEQGRPVLSDQAIAAARAAVGPVMVEAIADALENHLQKAEQILGLAGTPDAETDEAIRLLFGRLSWLTRLLGDRGASEGTTPAPAPGAPFTPNAITFINAPHTLAALRSMWAVANGQPDAWQRSEYGPPYYADQNGVHVYMQEGSEFNPQALNTAWQRVLSLDDNKVSTFLICIGKWMADTGGDTKTIVKARVHVADILSFRGLKKHRKGGYRRDQKEDARRDVLALNAIWVRSPETSRDEKGKPGPGAL